MQVDTKMKWKLRLLSDPERIDWQQQYTGFDPQLTLPEQIDNAFASKFLTAYAKFEDLVEELNIGKRSERPADQLYQFLREAEKSARSNTLAGVIKRAWFNTDVLEHSRGEFLRSYVKDYLFDNSKQFRDLLPAKPPRFGGTKSERKQQNEKIKAAKKPFEKNEGEKWQTYVSRFFETCEQGSDLSPRGFLDYLAARIKPQYVEPWLLYMGQSIDEVIDACEALHVPGPHKDYANALRSAFVESGLAEVVNELREMALAPSAQEEHRIVMHLNEPTGKVNHVHRVGGLQTSTGTIVCFNG